MADWLAGLNLAPSVVVMIILLVFLVGGSIIEDMAVLILGTPIFLPIVTKLGYDPVWFGIILMVTMMMGVILPPMAINVFVVSGIANVPLKTVYAGVYPFIVGMVLVNLLVLYVPQLSLWLPGVLMP
jgi:TRAP-type C4-dicarboxylate transport system permease large subunit